MTGSLNIISLRTGWEAQTYGEFPLIYRNISSRHGKSFAFSPTRYFVPTLAYAILQCSAVHFFLQQCMVFVFIKSCLMNSSKYRCKNPHYHNKRGKKTPNISTHSIDFSSFWTPRRIWFYKYITFNAFFITEPNTRIT